MGVCISGNKKTSRVRALREPCEVNTYRTMATLLGDGRYGTVFLAQKAKEPEKQFAVKIIQTGPNGPSEEDVKREVSVLQHLQHPNVLSLVNFYQSGTRFNLITEYCPGSDIEQLTASALRTRSRS